MDAEGIHPLESKLTAIVQAPAPKNVMELRSFLGLINDNSKFIRNASTILAPLNALLRKDVDWSWTPECQRSFNKAKATLVGSDVLMHYDPLLPIKMAGDASAYGIGAVISHVLPDGSERPVALSLVFGVKHFHAFLYGRPFTIVTDHKPLITILGPKKGIPPLAAARLQRWAWTLSAYLYDIEFRSTGAHANADGLSRLPLK